jgi:DNA-directed RNA polymerase specialized sigma24 family protein
VTNSELVRLARDGDRDAFDLLMTAVIDHLYRIARLILRDFDSAEDAVQEALVRCWRDLPGLRDPDRFDAWLNRLLLLSVTDEARNRRRSGRTSGFFKLNRPNQTGPARLPIGTSWPASSTDYRSSIEQSSYSITTSD